MSDEKFIEIGGHRLPLNHLSLAAMYRLLAAAATSRSPNLGSTAEVEPGNAQSDAVSSDLAANADPPLPGDDFLDVNDPRVRAATELRLETLNIRTALGKVVAGQDHAVDMLADAFVRNRLLPSKAGPKAVFLFAGPSLSGKGLTANALCRSLKDYSFLELDLGQLTRKADSDLLIGSEPSYQNAAPGKLTSHVMKFPKTVVLFRNIERCHPNVLALLAPMLSTGLLEDAYGIDKHGNAIIHLDDARRPTGKKGVPTDFRQAVLVFSTTAGESTHTSEAFQNLTRTRPAHAEVMLLDALAKEKATAQEGEGGDLQFTTGMINHWRGGRTVVFKHVNLVALTAIAENATSAYAATLTQTIGTELSGFENKTLLQAMLLSMAPEVNALDAQGALPSAMFEPLLDHLTQQHPLPPKRVHFVVSPQAVTDWEDVQLRLSGGSQEPRFDLLDQCRRRNLKLDLEWAVAQNCSQVTLAGLKLTQVKSTSDLTGPGAIKIEVPTIGFERIAGHSIIKSRLNEVIKLLNRSHEPNVRALIPAGMLLYGPPGTGKTMLAKAMAHEADLPFINTTGTELLDPDMTKQVFARARRYAPGIVFIDEIDALGSREKGGQAVAINQLLAEMDGFDSAVHRMVFVVAATNLPERVDPALRRPGRLDLHLEVPALDPPARSFFVDRIFKLPVSPELDKEQVVRLTAGMTGAELEKLQRELQLLMQRDGHARITPALLLETLNTLRYGQRSARPLTEHFLAHTAIHEAGHAVLGRLLNPEIPINQISVVPRGNADGFVAYDGEAMRNHRYTLQEIKERLCILLAGRNAQNIMEPGSADPGASDDLARATALATNAVTRWGLVPEAGLLAFDPDEHRPLQMVDAGVQIGHIRHLLQQADERCTQLLNKHWQRVEALQQRLLTEELIMDSNW